MTKISSLHQRWLKNPAYKETYNQSRIEFEDAQKTIQARMKNCLGQEDPAIHKRAPHSATD